MLAWFLFLLLYHIIAYGAVIIVYCNDLKKYNKKDLAVSLKERLFYAFMVFDLPLIIVLFKRS